MHRFDRAAALLADNRLSTRKLASLPDECRPQSTSEGYAVQFRLAIRLAEKLGPLAGWKIGGTTAVMQTYLGIDGPCAGGIFTSGVMSSPVTLDFAALRNPGVECEIVFRLGSGLPGGSYTGAQVAHAVAAAYPGMELVEARYADWRSLGTPTLIADDFFNSGLILGPEMADWRALDMAAAIGSTLIDGKEAGRGAGGDVLGHPMEALAWLANHLAAAGRPLEAGMLVSTGSIVAVQWLSGPAEIVARIEGLGEARLRLR